MDLWTIKIVLLTFNIPYGEADLSDYSTWPHESAFLSENIVQ